MNVKFRLDADKSTVRLTELRLDKEQNLRDSAYLWLVGVHQLMCRCIACNSVPNCSYSVDSIGT